MFPLAAVGTGLSLLSGLSGLFGGQSAERRARLAEDLAIRDFKSAGEQMYSDALGSGQRNLFGMTGTLNDSLASMGRGLGAATAGAGVYNSSATAGALANQQAANAQAIGQYGTNLADNLAEIRNRNNQQAASMQFGLAQNDLNFARQQTAGSRQGLASLLGNLGQISFANSGAAPYNPNRTGNATNGNTNSVLQVPRLNTANLGLGY